MPNTRSCLFTLLSLLFTLFLMTPILEVCVGSVQSALAAKQGGAARIELCSALEIGGITPSAGLMEEVRAVEGLKMHVLIRPRGGDFLYDKEEVACMIHDIHLAKRYGADGIVIGALQADGAIDAEACRRMIDAAEGMQITFHRAFDMCSNPLQAIETIHHLGCHRLLTSGCAPTALQGLPLLQQLTAMQTGVIIMPGCGVKSGNVAEIVRGCGATEVHASARKSFASLMAYRPESVKMGNPDQDEFARCETDADEVSAIVSELAQFA